MKKILKKFKKLKKFNKISFFIVEIIFFITICFFIYNLLLLKNIETFIRIIIIILSILSIFFTIFINILLLFSKKNKLYITNSILMIIISIVLFILSFNIFKTYGIVDNMSKNTIEYSSSLVVLKDTEFKNNNKFKVGMIKDENDIEGNILANELIDNKNLKDIDIVYYETYLEMLGDLYSNNINGLFISSNYVSAYNSYENYANIKDETKVVYSYKKKMKNQDFSLASNKSLTEPFTILLLGVDSETDGLNTNTAFNGDTMMLITFNPLTLNATIFSIPRDTYVPIACNNNRSSKINSSAAYGTNCVINTIKNLTDIDIDYYVKINFKGVVSLVDALDGITVDVPVKFCEQDSNRLGDSHNICLDKGLQELNGEQALALSRHRHSLPLGDFQRVQHQQLVVEAIGNKAKTIRSVDKFYNVLNAISRNIDTNISTDELLNLYNVGKKMFLGNNTSLNIQKTYLTGYDLTLYIPGLGNVYTFQYYEQSLNEITKAMKINLGLIEPELTKTFSFSVNEPYEAPIIGKEYYTVKRNEAMPNFIGSTINYLKDWASSRNITIIENYITEGMTDYDKDKNGIITNQNVVSGTLVSSVSTMTVDVIKVEDKKQDKEEDKEDNKNNKDDDKQDDNKVDDKEEESNKTDDNKEEPKPSEDNNDKNETDTNTDSNDENNSEKEEVLPPTNLPIDETEQKEN